MHQVDHKIGLGKIPERENFCLTKASKADQLRTRESVSTYLGFGRQYSRNWRELPRASVVHSLI
jgi:hypothetical protein